MQNNTPQFKDMVAIQSNSFLALLNAVWKTRAFDTEIACAYETRAYPGLGRLIVERKSATSVCTRREVKGLAFDHAGIVKPNGRTHPSHDWLVAEIIKPRRQKGWEMPRWGENHIIIGAKDHIESNIHAAMMTVMLRHEAPELTVTPQYFSGHASRLFNALKDRAIDLYPEYDGTLMYEYLGDEPANLNASSHALTYSQIEINQALSLDPRTSSLRMLPHFGFHNPYVLVTLRSRAKQFGLIGADGRAKISGLQALPEKRLAVIADQEFQFRKDGWPGLRERYGLRHAQYSQNAHAGIYQRLASTKHDSPGLLVGVGFGTDAELHQAGSNFLILDDDKAHFPHYHPAPLVDRRLLRKFPRIEDILAKLSGAMNAKEMSELIAAVSQLQSHAGVLPVERQTAMMEAIARNFLVGKEILKVSNPAAQTVNGTIGGIVP